MYSCNINIYPKEVAIRKAIGTRSLFPSLFLSPLIYTRKALSLSDNSRLYRSKGLNRHRAAHRPTSSYFVRGANFHFENVRFSQKRTNVYAHEERKETREEERDLNRTTSGRHCHCQALPSRNEISRLKLDKVEMHLQEMSNLSAWRRESGKKAWRVYKRRIKRVSRAKYPSTTGSGVRLERGS